MVPSYLSDDEEEPQEVPSGKDIIQNFLNNNRDITPLHLATNVPLFLEVLGIEGYTGVIRPVSTVHDLSHLGGPYVGTRGLTQDQVSLVGSASSYLLSRLKRDNTPGRTR